MRPLLVLCVIALISLTGFAGSIPFSPKFQYIRDGILLICGEIARNSVCGYWEHPNQFVSPRLYWRWL